MFRRICKRQVLFKKRKDNLERGRYRMISIQKGLEDFNELRTTIKGVKDINTLVELIYDNPRYNITNDLRDTRGIIDINYKSICATIQQKEDSLAVLGDVEVWDNDGSLDFVLVNMYNYSKYNTSISEDGKVYVKSSHPYDEQEYYYAVGNNIYRNGKFIEKIKESENHYIDGIDEIILRLMELNRPLKSIMCYN